MDPVPIRLACTTAVDPQTAAEVANARGETTDPEELRSSGDLGPLSRQELAPHSVQGKPGWRVVHRAAFRAGVRLVAHGAGSDAAGCHEMLWHEMLRDRMLWDGMLRDRMLWDGMLWDEMRWDGTLRARMVWGRMLWNGMMWNGMVWDRDGVV
jgi:hypothetical protein